MMDGVVAFGEQRTGEARNAERDRIAGEVGGRGDRLSHMFPARTLSSPCSLISGLALSFLSSSVLSLCQPLPTPAHSLAVHEPVCCPLRSTRFCFGSGPSARPHCTRLCVAQSLASLAISASRRPSLAFALVRSGRSRSSLVNLKCDCKSLATRGCRERIDDEL